MRLFRNPKRYLLLFLVFISLATRSQPLDLKILKNINQGEYPKWDNFMLGTSKSVFIVMPLSILVPAIDGYHRNDQVMIRNAYKSAITIGVAALVTSTLKFAIQRPRPKVQYPNDIIERDHAGPYSFPSGHTTAAFASATALTLSYQKWYVAVPAYLYAGLVGYSRMRLGMHFPTDVLGGMVVGIGAGLLTWKLDKVMNGK
ncbi:MAG: phosphatase PAP2 family protein [bacterium]|nr:phosphatase PAP2 family protein [bacterium]